MFSWSKLIGKRCGCVVWFLDSDNCSVRHFSEGFLGDGQEGGCPYVALSVGGCFEVFDGGFEGVCDPEPVGRGKRFAASAVVVGQEVKTE